MLFEVIDRKGLCHSIYANGAIHENPSYLLEDQKIGNDLITWNYHSLLKDFENVKYAYLYCNGKNLDQACPEHLKEEWKRVRKKHSAFIRSFKEGKVETGSSCFYDLVPETFLKDFFAVRCLIAEHVIQKEDEPKNYDFLVELSKFCHQISQQRIKLDLNVLNPILHHQKTRAFKRKIQKVRPFVEYNIFGAITGRLSTKPASFPILSLDKEFRSVILPDNDMLIDFDINGAELRTMIALNGKEQPIDDIHEWHRQEFEKAYRGGLSRDEAKLRVLKWLYGSNNASIGVPSIDEAYDKESLLDRYWNGFIVETPFGRVLPSDRFHAANRIIQSSSNDIFLRQALKVAKMLIGKKSFVKWGIHDSLTLDFALEDKPLLPNLIRTFGQTDYGFFRVNLKAGKNYGRMKEFQHEAAHH